MKWTWGALLLLSACQGCGANLSSKVIGTWKVDPSTVQVTQPTPSSQPGWNIIAPPPSDTFRLIFKPDGKLESTGQPLADSSQGTWILSDHEITVAHGNETDKMKLSDTGDRIHVDYKTVRDGEIKMDLVRVASS